MRSFMNYRFTLAGLICVVAFSGRIQAAAPNDVVYLSIREPGLRSGPPTAGLLVRELARQAFLIAARDECGVATRDKCLREEPSYWNTPTSRPFELQLVGKKGQTWQAQILVSRKSDKGRDTFYDRSFDVPADAVITGMVEKCEELSRSDFKELLRKQGYDNPLPAPRATSDIPKEVEQQLATWDRVGLFRALRVLHAEVHEKGESPELLAATAVAYANLGVVTECDWSPAHKAFKARAILYAERLVHRTGGSALAFRIARYVRALVGLHVAAIDDVREARERQTKSATKSALPPWLDTIDLFCEGKLQPMVANATTASEPAKSLARMLELLAYDSTGDGYQTERAAAEMLEAKPDCFRAVEARCEANILGVSHRAIPEMMRVFQDTVNRRLLEVPACPRRCANGSNMPRI